MHGVCISVLAVRRSCCIKRMTPLSITQIPFRCVIAYIVPRMEENEGEDRKRKPEDGTGKRNEPPNHSDEEDNEEDAQSSGGEEETIYKEKKRRREKQRRTDLNRALEQLSQVIFMIDPRLKAEAEERLNRNSTNKSRRIEPGAMLSRVELINGASLTLQRLHRENEERKVVIAQLSGGVLAAAGQGNLMHAGGAFGQHNLATRAFPNQLPPGVPPTFSEQDALVSSSLLVFSESFSKRTHPPYFASASRGRAFRSHYRILHLWRRCSKLCDEIRAFMNYLLCKWEVPMCEKVRSRADPLAMVVPLRTLEQVVECHRREVQNRHSVSIILVAIPASRDLIWAYHLVIVVPPCRMWEPLD